MQLKFGDSKRHVGIKNQCIAAFQPQNQTQEIPNMEQPESGSIARRHLQQNAHRQEK